LCKTEEDVFKAIRNSIRTTFIVSDKAGYQLILDLMSGISFNHSINNIIILNKNDEDELPEELLKKVEEFNNPKSEEAKQPAGAKKKPAKAPTPVVVTQVKLSIKIVKD